MNDRCHMCSIQRADMRVIVLVLVAILLMAPSIHATKYFTFTDGHVHVFPTAYILSISTRYDVVTVTDRHGGTYVYNRADIVSIENELSKELPTFTSYLFDNKYNYQVPIDAIGLITNDQVNASVCGIGKRLTATFTLSDNAARAYVNGVEQTSAVSRLCFDSSVQYTVGYLGDMILSLSSEGEYVMMPFGRLYTVTADFLTDHSTSVPRIDINTVDGVSIVSKEEYVDAEIIIDGAGVFPSMTDSVKIRGRGNTSWSPNPAAKNPYRLKFSEKVKPFGLTKGKNWVLLANKQYGSMLTTAVGMKAASLIGVVAANHVIPVDLYINGTYKGNYNFTEKVGASNNSVDLDDETVAALLELDYYFDEADNQKFRSDPGNIPVNVKHPEFEEDETFLTLTAIQSRFNAFVNAANNGEDLADYVDIDKLARYMMFNELACNKEIYHPKSLFCYWESVPDNASKLVFGPAWDFDWAFGYAQGASDSYFNNLINYDYFNLPYTGLQYQFVSGLGKDQQVSYRMFQLWWDFIGDGLDELCEFCQDYYDYAAPSLINSKRAYADPTDYRVQATQAVNWLRQRADLIYQRLKSLHMIPGDLDGDGNVTINDVVNLIDYILDGTTDPFTEMVADVDGDGFVAITDLTVLIDELFAH